MSEDPDGVGRVDAVRVEEALALVLGSRSFRNAPRQRELLSFLVQEVVAGRGGVLRERRIADAINSDASFDPKIDPSVRVLASRLRARLIGYYQGEGTDDEVVFEIPVGGYAPRIVTRSVERSPVAPIVVVCAFVAGSSEPTLQDLAAGISDGLAARLAALDPVTVVGPVVATESPDPVVAAMTVAAGYAADLVVVGTVRSDDEVVRTVVRLVDAFSGATRWSEHVDVELDPAAVLAAEDRIVDAISAVLVDEYGPVVDAVAQLPPIGDAVGRRAMRGFYEYVRSLDEARRPEVIGALERAVEARPSHAPYLGALGAVLMFESVGATLGPPPSEATMGRAEALARRALSLDPTEPYGLLVFCFLPLIEGDPGRSRARARDLLESRRATPSVRSMCAVCLCLSDAWDEGIAELRAGHLANPALPTWQHGFVALDDLARGDASAALDHARRVDTPGLVWGPLLRAASYGTMGELDRGRAELDLVGGFPTLADRAGDLMRSHMRLPENAVAALLTGILAVAPVS